MKVSVFTTTYNHEKYIAQAIGSALEQRTNFDYEIVVGEDCSTDGTRAVLLQLHERYPDKIRLLLRETNWGRRPNFIDTLRSCRGEYVAMLEGDDYWTSPDKLQSQVDFLDSHPDCSICFHPVVKYYQADGREKLFRPSSRKEIYTLADLLQRNLMSTCSVMFRQGLFDEFPDWYHTIPSGDWPLHILNARHGNIGYIDRAMAVYRIHGGGVWSPKGAVDRLTDKITMLRTVEQDLAPDYQKLVKNSVAEMHLRVVHAMLRGRDFRGSSAYVLKLALRPDVPRMALFRSAMRLLRRRIGR